MPQISPSIRIFEWYDQTLDGVNGHRALSRPGATADPWSRCMWDIRLGARVGTHRRCSGRTETGCLDAREGV